MEAETDYLNKSFGRDRTGLLRDYQTAELIKMRDHAEKCVNFRSGCKIEAPLKSLQIKSQGQNEEFPLYRNV